MLVSMLDFKLVANFFKLSDQKNRKYFYEVEPAEHFGDIFGTKKIYKKIK